MKYMLSFILCSYVEGICMPPIEGGYYPTYFECLEKGYKKSHNIITELGLDDVEKQKYFIKFTCFEIGEPL